jgi:hypothetical protein
MISFVVAGLQLAFNLAIALMTPSFFNGANDLWWQSDRLSISLATFLLEYQNLGT